MAPAPVNVRLAARRARQLTRHPHHRPGRCRELRQRPAGSGSPGSPPTSLTQLLDGLTDPASFTGLTAPTAPVSPPPPSAHRPRQSCRPVSRADPVSPLAPSVSAVQPVGGPGHAAGRWPPAACQSSGRGPAVHPGGLSSSGAPVPPGQGDVAERLRWPETPHQEPRLFNCFENSGGLIDPDFTPF